MNPQQTLRTGQAMSVRHCLCLLFSGKRDELDDLFRTFPTLHFYDSNWHVFVIVWHSILWYVVLVLWNPSPTQTFSLFIRYDLVKDRFNSGTGRNCWCIFSCQAFFVLILIFQDSGLSSQQCLCYTMIGDHRIAGDTSFGSRFLDHPFYFYLYLDSG